MKHIIFTILGVLLLAGVVTAQDAKPVETPSPGVNQPQDVRGNALRQLGLSMEQMQQIRRLNMARKPMMDEAQKRVREATQALNQVIYADEVNEVEFHARLREFQLAQAEVAKLRFLNELGVRRILLRDQLLRFREIQRRFEEAVRENMQYGPIRNANNPANVRKQGNDAKSFQPNNAPVRPATNPNQKRPNF
jgi:Spy/CpxP family protein refolding chaperone